MVLVLICFTAVVAVLPAGGLQWTSDLPDESVLHACKGGNLTFPWNVTLDAGETIDDVKWFYHGGSREMIAMYSGGNFLTMPTFSHRVQHAGNAGFVLSQVTTSDAGNYSVEVVAQEVQHAPGLLSTHRQSAFVDVVMDPPVSRDVNLHVRQEPVAVYDQSTGEWRVALTCGTLTNRGQPPVDVIWTTPNGTTVSSTSYADGEFRLLLPNPVTGGTYTCHLPHDSPAAACLPKDSPILTPAAADVDRVEARLSLLEVEQKVLRQENENLKAKNANLTSIVHNMAVTRHVSFHARLASDARVSATQNIILSTVVSNDGGAYSTSTGDFTAPFSGIYAFFATASTSGSSYNAHLYMAVDGSGVSYLNADEDQDNMGSCHVVVYLTAGKRVSLKSNLGTSYFYSYTTTFSGFLIHAD